MNVDLRAAPATFAIAAATAIVSAALTLLGYEPHATIYMGFVPLRATLGLEGDVQGLAPVLLTPLTATLVHGGLLHLLMNLVMLVYTGVQVERAVGARGLILLYLIGAYAAAFAQWLPEPRSLTPMIGASGAAAAIVGAYAMLFGRSRAKAIGPVPARVVNALWLGAAWSVLNLVIAAVAATGGLGIAAAAHIGGFAVGLALVYPLVAWRWRGA
jgi:membrane associated rhomboid family serine protease